MLEGLLAPLRVVPQRSLADWLIVAATWLVIVCATTLLAIGVLYGDGVRASPPWSPHTIALCSTWPTVVEIHDGRLTETTTVSAV